jgi:hypothetical protein
MSTFVGMTAVGICVGMTAVGVFGTVARHDGPRGRHTDC